jgi:chromosome segregation ATPase
VQKLADKYSTAKTALSAQSTKSSTASTTSLQKLRETEEKLEAADAEIENLKVQRASLEKKIETMKAASKTSRSENSELIAALEASKSQVEQLEADLEASKAQIIVLEQKLQAQMKQMEDAEGESSPEMQALEEENLELMKENKELLRDVTTFRLQAERAQNQLAKLQNANSSAATTAPTVPSGSTSAAVSASKKRSFGTELSAQPRGNEENIIKEMGTSPASKLKKTSAVSDTGSTSKGVTVVEPASSENAKPRTRAKAVVTQPLAAPVTGDEAPEEGCAQS